MSIVGSISKTVILCSRWWQECPKDMAWEVKILLINFSSEEM